MADYVTSASDFSKLVEGPRPVIAMFTAAWCGPCKVVKPKFQEYPARFPEVAFAMIDVDEQKDIAMGCSIRAMPTFHGYNKGQKLGEVVGADLRALEDLINLANSKSAFGKPGHVLGGGSGAAAPAPPPDDAAARRQAMAAAAEARMKAMAAAGGQN